PYRIGKMAMPWTDCAASLRAYLGLLLGDDRACVAVAPLWESSYSMSRQNCIPTLTLLFVFKCGEVAALVHQFLTNMDWHHIWPQCITEPGRKTLEVHAVPPAEMARLYPGVVGTVSVPPEIG